LGAEGAEGEGVVAFGEALAGVVGDERTMVVSRGGDAEGAEKEQLAEGGCDEIRAADDFGDMEIGVVDGAGELIAGDVVFAPDEEIAEIATGDGALGTEVGVDEDELLVVGNAETPVGGDAIGERRKRGVGRRAERFWINRFVVEVRSAGGLGDVAARAGAWEDEAGGVEAGEGGAVKEKALALGDDGAVPSQAEPGQVFLKSGDEFGTATGGVEVVVAQEERAAGGSGALVSEPERARVAEVKVAGGGRRKASAIAGGVGS